MEDRTLLVGVGGGSASGKSTIVKGVVDRLGNERVRVVHCDSYYRDQSGVSKEERQSVNYDHPDALDVALLLKHVKTFRMFKAVDVPVYDFETHLRSADTRRMDPAPIVIVEGILALALDPLVAKCDLTVFVDAGDHRRFARRLERDRMKRGRSTASVLHQYLNSVYPMHQAYVLPSRSKASLILSGEENLSEAVDILVRHIEELRERE